MPLDKINLQLMLVFCYFQIGDFTRAHETFNEVEKAFTESDIHVKEQLRPLYEDIKEELEWVGVLK